MSLIGMTDVPLAYMLWHSNREMGKHLEINVSFAIFRMELKHCLQMLKLILDSLLKTT